MKQLLSFYIVFFIITTTLSAQNFELLKTLKGHDTAVSYIAFRAEDNLLVSGDEKGNVLIWDNEAGKIKHRLEGHTGLITHIAFSEKGEWLATASYDGSIRLWELATYRLIDIIENTKADVYDDLNGDELSFVAFAPDGNGIYYGGYNLAVSYTSFKTGKSTKIFSNEEYAITCGLISPSGEYIVIAFGHKIKFIPLVKNKKGFELENTAEDDLYICELAFKPESDLLASWTYGGTLQLWDIEKQVVKKTIKATKQPGTSNMAFDGNGQYLVTGNCNTQTKLWDTDAYHIIQILGKHNAEVVCFSFSGDGNLIATGSKDKVINLWKRALPDADFSEVNSSRKNKPESEKDNFKSKEISKDKAEEQVDETPIKDRLIETQHEIYVSSKDVELAFWDNQEIDGDIISVQLNNVKLLDHYTLKQTKKNIKVRLKETVNYFIVHAHNEGTISPNTLAIRINDGNGNQYRSLSSNLKTSGAIRVVYQAK